MKQVIKRPVVSEKNTTHLSNGVYVFEVDRKSNKDEIKRAIESFFRVKVSSVRTMVGRGKMKRTKQGVSRVKYYKKAMVKLAPGEKITLFEGV